MKNRPTSILFPCLCTKTKLRYIFFLPHWREGAGYLLFNCWIFHEYSTWICFYLLNMIFLWIYISWIGIQKVDERLGKCKILEQTIMAWRVGASGQDITRLENCRIPHETTSIATTRFHSNAIRKLQKTSLFGGCFARHPLNGQSNFKTPHCILWAHSTHWSVVKKLLNVPSFPLNRVWTGGSAVSGVISGPPLLCNCC